MSAAAFHTTRWTLVVAAAHGTQDTEGAARALGELLTLYRAPLLDHARRRGLAPADAEDSVQSFLARLLRPGAIAGAQRERGRFRSFLLGAFTHHLADLRDHARAARRDARLTEPLDLDTHPLTCPAPAPDAAFDRAWALALLADVTTRFRAELAAEGRADHADALLPLLAGRSSEAPHAAAAARLGLTEPALRVALHRLRQRYRRLLRAAVAETVTNPDEIDHELRHLLAALA